jgi:hypothetical protein
MSFGKYLNNWRKVGKGVAGWPIATVPAHLCWFHPMPARPRDYNAEHPRRPQRSCRSSLIPAHRRATIVADRRPTFPPPHMHHHTPRPYPFAVGQEKHRTALPPLLCASTRSTSMLCHVQCCSYAANRHYSSPAIPSPPQTVPQPRVELPVQLRHREKLL